MNLEAEKEQQRMRDSYAGYDWGNPITLWTVRARCKEFTPEELAIADRAAASLEVRA